MSSVRLVPPKDNHLFFKNQNRRLPAHLCASVLSAAFLGHLHFRLAVSAPQEPIYRHSDDMFNISEKQRFSRPLDSSVYQEEMLKRQLTFSLSAASSFSPCFSVLSFCSHFLLVPSFPPDPYLFILPLIFSSSVFYVSSPTGSMQRCLPGNLFHAFDYEKIKYKN